MTSERRKKILDILSKCSEPIKGMELAKKFNVSRQVIVQDIALLRAKGENIISTPQGYMLLKNKKSKNLIKTIACRHKGYDAIKDELTCIVDLGGKVIDVIVEHPLYGEIRSTLMIGSRLDVDNFMTNLKKSKAEPLSTLTNGIHLHSIEVENIEIFNKIKSILKQKGYLV